jgi:hypothetical protein
LGPVPIWLVALVLAVLAPACVDWFARVVLRRARQRALDTVADARRTDEPRGPQSKTQRPASSLAEPHSNG